MNNLNALATGFLREPINSLLRLAGAIAIVILFAPAAQANLIVNGTFDIAVPTNGTGGGWTSAGNDSAGGHRVTGGNPGGHFIINAAGAAATDPSIEQTLSGLIAGQMYIVAGDFTNFYNCCGSATALSFGVDVTPGGLLIELADPGAHPNWFSFATSFTATQSAHTIRFTAERNGDDTEYAIDNISVIADRAVSAPSTAMLALGLLVVGFANRRRTH